jgi:hypothetical protein
VSQAPPALKNHVLPPQRGGFVKKLYSWFNDSIAREKKKEKLIEINIVKGEDNSGIPGHIKLPFVV